MKKTLFGAGAMLLMCACWAVSQPKIQVSPGTTMQFGDYFQGQKAEHTVTLKNVGSDTLRITDVKAQCGCTAVLLADKVLGPSQEGKLSITFNTTGQQGRVTKEVFVSSNDPETPKVTIQFTTNVIQLLNLVPASFVFDRSVVDSTYTKTITITNPSQKQSVKILGIDSKFDEVKVSLLKNELMPGEQTQLQATFHPTRPGTFQGVISLATDSKLQPTYDVKIFTWVNRK